MHKNIAKYLLLTALTAQLTGDFTNICAIQILTRGNYLQEKLYVSTDRNLYFTGENIWFKIVCTELNYNIPVDLSRVAYFELFDPDNRLVFRHKAELRGGFGYGCVKLPEMLESGYYRIRACTNWMKNFSDDYFFIKNLMVINPDKEIAFRETDDSVPVKLTADFFPESGRIIKYMNNHIIIRVLNHHNEGINAGAILYKNDVAIHEFKIIRGIGSFDIKPDDQEYYYAKVIVNDSVSGIFELPGVHSKGITLNLSDFEDNNIYFNIRSNLLNQNNTGLPLLMKLEMNGNTYFSGSVFLNDTSRIINIPVSSVPEGISYVNLFNEYKELVCTRPIYNQPKKILDIEIITEKNEYNTREKVNTLIKTSIDNKPVPANLAVRVKRTGDPFEGSEIDFRNKPSLNNIQFEDIFNYYSDPDNKFSYSDINNALIACVDYYDSLSKVFDIRYLPEIKGPVISGRVINKDTRQPVWNHLVYLSAVGPCASILSCRTNQEGEFGFSLGNIYGTGDLVIQINDEQGKFILLLNEEHPENFNIQQPDNWVDSESKKYIIQNMINWQISKAYDLKQIRFRDTIPDKMNDFYGDPDESLILNDFVKLPVMEEVLVELLKSVLISARKGEKKILIINRNSNEIIGDSPLYLIDGVPVFDPGIILSMDPADLKSIKVVSSKYFLGELVFDGILDIHTNENKFDNIKKPKTGIRYKFESFIKPAEFVSPQYDSDMSRDKRIPDYRNTIYWDPSLVTDKEGIAGLSFFTSDEIASFDIIVEGISYNGYAGYEKYRIEVKQQNK